ncbi:MAG: carbohydrate kinase family protein [Bacteroidales bacterium]|nr:carbohydrate kinase family protein [Bacteroidales bacterium]
MENKTLFDVLVVGELNVDLILDGIEKFPEIGKEILAKNMIITLGSSSAIFASNLSALGTHVGFIGKVGTDNFADKIITSLNKKRVNTEYILRSSSTNTGATIALNYGEDRAMITFTGAMDELTIDDINPELLKKVKHLHLSSTFLQKGLKKDLPKLFKMAKQAGLTTSLDPQWDPSEKWDIPLNDILPYVDVFLPNRKEITNLTRTVDIDKAVKKILDYSNIVVVKDGSNGAYLWTSETHIIQPIFKNSNITDCIGAGDSFNAGFIDRFTRKKPLAECLEFAALMGAVNTTKPGGTTAFSNLEEIRNIASTRFNFSF